MNKDLYFHQLGKDPLYKTWHALDNIMIIRTYSDGGSIVVGEKAYPITENTLCLVGAGRYHYTMPDNPESYDRSKIFITKEQFSAIRKLFRTDNFKNELSEDAFIYAQLDKASCDDADRIFEELNTSYESTYRDAVILSAFIKLLILADKFSVEGKSTLGYMSKAVEYIGSNIFTELDIDSICTHIHMSKYYFCRKFKEHTGMTVMAYILKTRLMLAKDMLIKEKSSVSEISEKCGFSSISYFCQVFKADTGLSPLRYRKKSERQQKSDG